MDIDVKIEDSKLVADTYKAINEAIYDSGLDVNRCIGILEEIKLELAYRFLIAPEDFDDA